LSDNGTGRFEAPARPEGRRRLFLALWPGDAVRRRLRDVLDQNLRIRSGRAEQVANLHVTLVFIGPIAGERVSAIEQTVAGVSGAAFELVLERIGYWERPRILWLGPREVPAALLSLVRDLRAALETCGVTAEKRPYLPHMTLARKVHRPPAVNMLEPIRWPVSVFSLMESVPVERSSAYRELACWPLRANDKPHEPGTLSG
jgi:2'-5' RNA ligase